MAYTDDWESLMNGVFGAGGKLKFGGAQPQPEKPQPEKPAASAHKRISERPSPPLQQALTERAVLCYIKAERSGRAAACRI